VQQRNAELKLGTSIIILLHCSNYNFEGRVEMLKIRALKRDDEIHSADVVSSESLKPEPEETIACT
jgi:hypothetical protein